MAKTKVSFEVQWDKNAVLPSDGLTCSIEVPYPDLTIDQVFEELIIPLLLAAGYANESIEGYLDGGR